MWFIMRNFHVIKVIENIPAVSTPLHIRVPPPPPPLPGVWLLKKSYQNDLDKSEAHVAYSLLCKHS